MDIHSFLADIWFGIVGLILALYVILDGFDLGVGILTLFSRDEEERGIKMATLGSVWDANETWLVVLGGALFGAFPLVYSVVLTGLYIPIMAMLFGLIFRAAAFEFRENARRKRLWNIAFGVGSLVAALAQGLALGTVIGGMTVEAGRYTGSVLAWLAPFPIIVACGVVCGYVLLGSTYLVAKTTGGLQESCYRLARPAAWLTVLVGIAISVWTPLHLAYVFDKWFGPGMSALAPLPLAAAFSFLMLLRSLRRRREVAPFVWSVLIFVSSLLGLAASLYPNIVPPSVGVHGAAASSSTLVFMLTGVGMLIPIMLIYNAYQYLVFRGKVTGSGY